MPKLIFKKLLLLLLASLAASAYAVSPGFYMGLDLGGMRNSASNQTVTISPYYGGPAVNVSGSPQTTSFDVRTFIGYKGTPYIGGEFGLSYMTPISYSLPVKTTTTAQTGIATGDLVVIAYLSLCSLDIFAKGGAAIIYQGTSRSIRPALNKSKFQTYVRPTFSLGASYDLSQNWVFEATYNRITNVNYFGNVNIYLIGISYHFVNRYCGQFLCDD